MNCDSGSAAPVATYETASPSVMPLEVAVSLPAFIYRTFGRRSFSEAQLERALERYATVVPLDVVVSLTAFIYRIFGTSGLHRALPGRQVARVHRHLC